MNRPVEYRHGCDTNAPDVRIIHGAKHAKHKQDYKFEARNPKYETNSNGKNPNVQNHLI